MFFNRKKADRIAPEQLRSHRWFGPDDLRSFGHRSRTKQMGYADEEYRGRPVIAILNTWSDLNPCHMHFKSRVEDVKRGILRAGGFPVELPALSVTETYMKPSPMLYRNLLAMQTEEMLRSQPIDGAVLMGGCDKTTPGLLMGAITMDLPAIYMPAGPMLRGNWRGEPVGSGSTVWKAWADRCGGALSEEAWDDLEDGIARSAGHCMTMGTASTMTSAAEALGFTLPGAASIPAVDSNHVRMASESGARCVDMVWEDLRPSTMLTDASFENAATTVLAIGGSTNAIVHLTAMARRAGCALDLRRFDVLSRRTPQLADIMPIGRFLMEDFYYAGGLRGLMSRIDDLLDLDAATVTGRPLREIIDGAEVFDDDVIRPRDNPVSDEGGTAVLFGNLAPDGAVIKHGIADERFHRHTGPAVVFEDMADLKRRIDEPGLEVDENSVLVLKHAGPLGGPGMPEWGMLPLPKKLLERGVRDMVRLSDARMSGTSYGTCVLHISPESYVGGPLALVEDGDEIELDVPGRRLELLVSDEELARRREAWTPPEPRAGRGFAALYEKHVTQAHLGCDFDFLERGGEVPEPQIF
ncbi:MAG: L-arabinonate dehydratase [Rhodothermales bacterium]